MRCKALILLLIAVLPFVCCAQKSETTNRPAKWAQPINQLSLKNFYKVDKGIYRSEQPNEISFAELEKFGIKEVLNLRNWHSDDKEAQNTNLILHRVDMDAHDINNHDIVAALQIIKNRTGSIDVHCKHGSDRTGLVIAMYRIIFQNWSKEDAIDELKNGGYGYHRIYFNIINYIQNADIEKLRQQINQ